MPARRPAFAPTSDVEGTSDRFGRHEPVFHASSGPVFGDDVWEWERTRRNQTERSFDLTTIPVGWRLAAREICITLARPDHPSVVAAGIVRRARPVRTGTISETLFVLRTIACWADSKDISCSSALTVDDCLRFLEALRSGTHAPGARPVSPATARRYLEVLHYFFAFRDLLTGGGLDRDPLSGRTSSSVAGEIQGRENLTAPLPFEQWSAVIRAAWLVVDTLGPEIVEADLARRRLPEDARGSNEAAATLLTQHLEAGGAVPLHTGYGHHRRPPGAPNLSLLCRLLGVPQNVVNSRTNGFRPDLLGALEWSCHDLVDTWL